MAIPTRASNVDALAAIGQQLNDASYLVLPEQRLAAEFFDAIAGGG